MPPDVHDIAEAAARIALDKHDNALMEEVRGIRSDISTLYGQTRAHDVEIAGLKHHRDDPNIHHLPPCPMVKSAFCMALGVLLAALGLAAALLGFRGAP